MNPINDYMKCRFLTTKREIFSNLLAGDGVYLDQWPFQAAFRPAQREDEQGKINYKKIGFIC